MVVSAMEETKASKTERKSRDRMGTGREGLAYSMTQNIREEEGHEDVIDGDPS